MRRRTDVMHDRQWLEQAIGRLMAEATREQLDLLWRFLRGMLK